MAEIKTIYKGESVTLLFTFPEAYDMARLASHKVFVGETEFAGVVEGQAIKMQLKSSDTDHMIGTHKVVLWIDDAVLGLRKPYCGDLVVAKTQASGSNASVSNISDIIIPLVISETAITVGDVLYNYVKGDKGDPFLYSDFTPEQIAELKQPATEAITSIQEVELAVETAEGLRVQAELNRQTNTATAIQNAETATTNANDAASLANEKAGLADTAKALALEVANNPDKVVADYWWKWNTTTKSYENTGIKAKGEAGAVAVVETVRSQSTVNVPASKVLDDELLKTLTSFNAIVDIRAHIAVELSYMKFTPNLSHTPVIVRVYSVGKLMDVTTEILPDKNNLGKYIIRILSNVDIYTANVVVLSSYATNGISITDVYTHINFDTLLEDGNSKDISGQGRPLNKYTATYGIGKHGNGICCDGTGKKAYIGRFINVNISPQIVAHQGVIATPEFIYLIDTNWIKKVYHDYSQVSINSNINAECGCAHVSDGCIKDGVIYLGAEQNFTGTGIPQIAMWNADTLAYIGKLDISASQTEVSGVCYNKDDGYFYTTDYVSNKIRKYDANWAFIGEVPTFRATNAQGIDYYNGKLYISAGSSLVVTNGNGDNLTASNTYIFKVEQGISFLNDKVYSLLYYSPTNSVVMEFIPETYTLNEITISFFIKTKYLPSEIPQAYMRLFGLESDNISIFYNRAQNNMTLKVTNTSGSTPRATVSGVNLIKNDWMHITAVIGKTINAIYINGVKKSDIIRDGNDIVYGNGVFDIGGGYSLDGCVDDLQIFKRVLTPQEVMTNYIMYSY